MSRYSIVSIALIAVVSIAPAAVSAADMEGRVQSVDASGAVVKVSDEEKDGKPVATSIEVK